MVFTASTLMFVNVLKVSLTYHRIQVSTNLHIFGSDAITFDQEPVTFQLPGLKLRLQRKKLFPK